MIIKILIMILIKILAFKEIEKIEIEIAFKGGWLSRQRRRDVLCGQIYRC